MSKKIVSAQQYMDLMEDASSFVFKALPTLSKRDQRRVKPGVTVVVKWLDAMPTLELVVTIENKNGKYEAGAALELLTLRRGHKHRMATCDQIVAVVGQIA